MMNSEEILTNTISNGEVEVHVSPVGTFYGSDAEGNAIPENLTEDSLQRLADQLNASNEQILVDADHASCRTGIERDTSACGWLEKFFVKPFKGLWAKLKLTNKGRDLVENRVYRFLSPVFRLDENGEPIQLNSVAMTNCPALAPDIAPIINTKPKQETLEMTMTKDELVALIKDTVLALNSCPSVEKKEEVQNAEPEKKEEACNACTSEEKKDVENAESEVKEETPEEKVEVLKEAIKDEDKLHEEVKESLEEKLEDAKDEAKAENSCSEEDKKDKVINEETEEKKEEVIKMEALNSAPTALTDVSGKSNWMNLHGDAFWKYLAEHPEIKG